MKRSTWRVLAFGALMGAVTLPASAQVVIGGSGTPNVEVNWSVLDGLGRQPTLPDLLRSEAPTSEARAALGQPRSKGVEYRPYKAGATPYAKPSKPTKPAKAVASKPKKSSVVPASSKSNHMADLVRSSSTPAAVKAEPVAPPAAEVKPVEVPRASVQPPVPPKALISVVPDTPKPAPAPAIIGPQIALPEAPKPAPVAPSAPVQLAKAESPLPPTALTPPPAAKVEPAPQLASLPPAPAPVATAAASRGDILSVPFTVDSARLPEGAHTELDRLVKRMQKDEGLALQLLAYAEGDDANASKARRLSLSRALEVRKYLMEQGLRSTRIEVRALGNKLDGPGSPDRVDAVLVSR